MAPVPSTESPPRTLRRLSTGRTGLSTVLRLGPWPFSGRYALYCVLLLVGFLAGSVLRTPYSDTSHPLALSALAFSNSHDTLTKPDRYSNDGRGGDGQGHGSHAHRSTKLAAQPTQYDHTTSATHSARVASGTDDAAGAAAAAPIAEPVAAAPPPVPHPPLAPANRTLRFAVCNGFANQRLSVLYGCLLAKRLGRAAVLPVLVDNGLQRSDDAVLASQDNQIPFADVYDQPHFIRAMDSAGVRVLAPGDAPPQSSYAHVALAPYGWSVTKPLAAHHSASDHLSIDCPLFKIMGFELSDAEVELLWTGLGALRPSQEAAALLDQISAEVVRVGAERAALAAKAAKAAAAVTVNGSDTAHASDGAASGTSGQRGPVRADTSGAASEAGAGAGFNFIHLRIENDWVEHCRRWGAIRDGLVRDNCYSHTDEIGARLALFGFPTGTPLYVASFWEDVEPSRRDQAFSQLAAAGYTVVTSADVSPAPRTAAQAQGRGQGAAAAAAGGQQQGPQPGGGGGGGRVRGREYAAMIEYFLGMRAERFIGNSVSTFAALGLIERRHGGRWAAYYNGGNVPLAPMLPQLHPLPWVFTYNSWSPDYDYMLKGAVRSALATRSLAPHCVFLGDPASPIAAWLRRHNVTLISHTPAWTDALLAKARAKARDNVAHSHLFKTPEMLVSTFQRVDLPVVPELQQYTYVLYTDADVYFRRPIRLDDFGLPLPTSISMSYEFVNAFPYNAGVILANLPTMRQRYDDFIRMMLDNDDGLYYPNYGPADQGILNKFYEADLRARLLSPAFNAKPYAAFDSNAFIVHFHGPKPHELLDFLATGKCDFFSICENAILNSMCAYSHEWVEWVPDSVPALRLEDACAWLERPAVAEVAKKKWGLAGGVAAIPAGQQAELAKAEHFRAARTAASGAASVAAADQKRTQRLRRALQHQLALSEPEEEQQAAKGQVRPSRQARRGPRAGAGAAGAGAGAGKGLMRGGRGAGQEGRKEAPAAQHSPAKLLSFDTVTAVTVDKEALDAAWGDAVT